MGKYPLRWSKVKHTKELRAEYWQKKNKGAANTTKNIAQEEAPKVEEVKKEKEFKEEIDKMISEFNQEKKRGK